VSIASNFNKSGLVERAKNIILNPVETWDTIAAERATVKGLFAGYAAILAVIPPAAGFIGGQVFGFGMFGITYRPSFFGSLTNAIVHYVLSLVGVYIFALIIDALASTIDGQKSPTQALKVAVYSYTAAWVSGVFAIFPALSFVAILGGIYSLYLVYLGLPRLMNAPQNKAIAYTAACAVAGIVLAFAVAKLGGLLGLDGFSPSGPGHITSSDGSQASGKIRIGGATIDLDQMNAASKQIDAATKQVANNSDRPAVVAISADILKTYLPDSVAGYSRGDIEANSGGVAGFTGSNVGARYSKSDAHINLNITDLGAAGGFAGLAGAIGVEANKETADGYQKIGKVDGRMTTEEWSKDSKSGKYGVLVADRFMIEADGYGADMDELKAAVAAVGPNRLESLAKK
jgi:hypothetical protein